MRDTVHCNDSFFTDRTVMYKRVQYMHSSWWSRIAHRHRPLEVIWSAKRGQERKVVASLYARVALSRPNIMLMTGL